MASKVINQKEYLKKYLSSGVGKDTKKKKRKKTVKIIDDDIDLKNMRPMEDGEFEIFLDSEEAPQIAGIVDERGPVDFTDKRRWKIVADNEGGDVKITSENRQKQYQSSTFEEEIENSVQDADFSKKHKHNEDTSPLRRQRKHLDDNDLSPPRKSREKSKKDKYEKKMYEEKCSNNHHKRSKYDNDDDMSPKRHRKYPDDKDSRRLDRKSSRKYKEKSELESLKRRHFDLSASRKNKEENVRNDDFDLSPPRKDRRKSNVYDKSRKHKRSSRSLSHEKEKGHDRSLPHKYAAQEEHEIMFRYTNEHVKKTLGGKKAGLKDLETLREEIEAQRKHEAELNKLRKNNIEQSSLNVPIQRDRKRLLKTEAAEQRAKEERQAELDEKYAVWGKGLKQVEDHEEKLKRDLYEISKPLARYADDEDLNKEFREQERKEDPMLEYLKQKQIKEGKRKPDPPSYQGTFMPNRFGIKPGHRWDGVDRSNGYEKKWFEAQNAKVAWQEDAYKWSTADM